MYLHARHSSAPRPAPRSANLVSTHPHAGERGQCARHPVPPPAVVDRASEGLHASVSVGMHASGEMHVAGLPAVLLESGEWVSTGLVLHAGGSIRKEVVPMWLGPKGLAQVFAATTVVS
jgi:hypothetical protein